MTIDNCPLGYTWITFNSEEILIRQEEDCEKKCVRELQLARD